MPKEFEACRKAGGRIRTVKPSASTYMPVCVRPKGKGPRGGKTVAGEVKHRKGRR